MATPKTPPGYKLYARAWGKAKCNDDVRILKNRGYITKTIKRRETPNPLRPKAKMDRYYIYGKR